MPYYEFDPLYTKKKYASYKFLSKPYKSDIKYYLNLLKKCKDYIPMFLCSFVSIGKLENLYLFWF